MRERETGGRSTLTPLGAVGRGLAAGVVGTVAMDLVWFVRYRRSGGEQGFLEWEFSSRVCTWDDVPAPAQMGKRLIEGVIQREVPPERAPLVNNLVHWAYGILWGTHYGTIAGSLRRRRLGDGLVFGSIVFGASYAVLPVAKLYRPIWEYDRETLWKDLSAHLVYGLGTAAAFELLSRRQNA
jgi:hypothetical protein